MNFLKRHWGNIAAIAATVAGYVDWKQVAAFSHAHKNSVLGAFIAFAMALYNARAPKDKQ